MACCRLSVVTVRGRTWICRSLHDLSRNSIFHLALIETHTRSVIAFCNCSARLDLWILMFIPQFLQWDFTRRLINHQKWSFFFQKSQNYYYQRSASRSRTHAAGLFLSQTTRCAYVQKNYKNI
jgi:hypothetical protein